MPPPPPKSPCHVSSEEVSTALSSDPSPGGVEVVLVALILGVTATQLLNVAMECGRTEHVPGKRGIGEIDEQIAELFGAKTTAPNRENMKADNVKAVIKKVLADYSSQLAATKTGASNVVVYGIPLYEHELDVIREYEAARQETLDTAAKTVLQQKQEEEAREQATQQLTNEIYKHYGGSAGHKISQSVLAAAAAAEALDASQREEEDAIAAEEEIEWEAEDDDQWEPKGLATVSLPPPRKRAASGSPLAGSSKASGASPATPTAPMAKKVKYRAPSAKKQPKSRKNVMPGELSLPSPAPKSSSLNVDPLAAITPAFIAEHMAKKEEADKQRDERLVAAMASAVSGPRTTATTSPSGYQSLNLRPDVLKWGCYQVSVWLTNPESGVPPVAVDKLKNLCGEDLELLDVEAMKESFGLDLFSARKVWKALSKLTE